MEDYNIFASRVVTKNEPLAPGHRACIGCGEVLAMRLAAKAFNKNTIVVNATGCMEIIASQVPYNSWRLPWIHTLFENAAAVASGIESAIKVLSRKNRIPEEEIHVVALGGDGATVDIGIQALSGAFERGHNITYICFDNEAYMNTGIQRSSATPFGASTTTSPAGKKSIGQSTWKKDTPSIMVAHNIPYVATACPSYPFDLMEKIEKALSTNGPSYIHIFSVCPTGWRTKSDLAIRLGRLAVETGVFPLYEVENGVYKMNKIETELKPLSLYTKPQGRFKHLNDDQLSAIEARIHSEYEALKEKCELTQVREDM
jgi:pyruvate ferredoxin oxidoreductase beta subunit